MIALTDIAWAAGFLEGEGHFSKVESGVAVSQIEREPLDRLRSLFGGNIREIAEKRGHRAHHVWTLHGSNAAAAMMTVWAFMSAKRRTQIDVSLSIWRNSKVNRVSRNAPCCPRGHSRSVYAHSKVSGCAECRRIEKHEDYLRLKEAA